MGICSIKTQMWTLNRKIIELSINDCFKYDPNTIVTT